MQESFMMKLKDVKNIFHNELDQVFGNEEVNSFFFMLTEDFFGANRLTLALQPDFPITKQEADRLFDALSQLKDQKPIQQIIGKTTFFGNELMINEHVLIPRPETEELVAWVVSEVDDRATINILDVGTGSGCIAISLAKALPSAKVSAIDVSKDALALARENAALNGVAIDFLETDILQLESLEPAYDIIVSNPPYVREMEKAEMKENVLDHEPHLALFVSNDDPLLFYRKITQLAIENLKEKGSLFFEINQYLGDEMLAMLKGLGFKDVELRRDIFGIDRMIKATK